MITTTQKAITSWAQPGILLPWRSFFRTRRSRPLWEETYLQAQNFISSNQPDVALQMLQKIPRDDPHYGEMAAEEIERLNQQNEAGNIAKKTQGAMQYFEHNIKLFIEKYIDAPEGKRSQQRKIATVYKFDRKSYIRVLIKYRIDYYLDKYAGCREEEQVKKYRRKYIKEIDLSEEPSYRDVEVVAETELSLRHFGAAYRAIRDWEKKNPNSSFQGRIDEKKDTIWKSILKEWDFEKGEVDRKEEDGSYTGAIGDLKRMLNLCEGYDTPEGLKLINMWKDRIEAIERKVSEKSGIQFRSSADTGE